MIGAILPIVTHPAYLLGCALVGVAGRKRRMGFFGFLIFSFLLTPLLGAFVLFVSAPRLLPGEEEDDEDEEEERRAEAKARETAIEKPRRRWFGRGTPQPSTGSPPRE